MQVNSSHVIGPVCYTDTFIEALDAIIIAWRCRSNRDIALRVIEVLVYAEISILLKSSRLLGTKNDPVARSHTSAEFIALRALPANSS